MNENGTNIEMKKTAEHRICIFCETWESGGIERFIYNCLTHMERCGLEIDIVVAKLKESIFTLPLKEAGVQFIELTGKNLLHRYTQFRCLLRMKKYNVLHVNAFQGMTLYYAQIAKEEGVPIRILHSHNTALRKSRTRFFKVIAHHLYCRLYTAAGTDFWACSKAAAEFMFLSQHPYKFIPNAIRISHFRRNVEIRRKIRALLGVENCVVIGNVGRLCYQKNQAFLLDVMHVLLKKRPDYSLLLVGNGEDQSALEEKAARLGISNKVIFFGVTSAVECLLWAMDVFAFPSRFEGLGIAVIEAIAANLPVVCSENVPEEATSFQNVQRLSLAAGADIWAEHLIAAALCRSDRDCNVHELRDRGFDISQLAVQIRNCYIGMES